MAARSKRLDDPDVRLVFDRLSEDAGCEGKGYEREA
jgi:hypothetical protein